MSDCSNMNSDSTVDDMIAYFAVTEHVKYLHSCEWVNKYLFKARRIQFYNNFKINKETFFRFIDYYKTKNPTRNYTTFQSKLLIFLYYVTRNITYRDCSEKFGRSTH